MTHRQLQSTCRPPRDTSLTKGSLRRIGAILALIVLPVYPALALTYEQAGENLTYLLSAPLAAKRCAGNGTPVDATFGPWRIEHTKDLNEAVAVIRAKAKSQDLDEGALVSFVLRESQRTALEKLDKQRVACSDFKAFLDDVDRHLER